MRIKKKELKEKIIESLRQQGFKVNPHVRPAKNEKDTLKKVHAHKRHEQLKLHRNFLLENYKNIKKYSVDGKKLNPSDIKLKLIEVKSGSLESDIFLWWNLIWWSVPFDRPIGRQMKFLIWDEGHNSPFGLIGLQSPPLRSSVRDEFLKLNSREDIEYWINQSMYGQRIGALPPYNELLGGKMVGLALTSNEVRKAYEKKYEGRKTLMKKREIPNKLLFITTTSAYGKSSVYERINYKDEKVSKFIGFTAGKGTFHISQELYEEALKYLEQKGINTERGYGTGPSRKLELLGSAFRFLDIPKFTFHNIKRGYYYFPLAKNVDNVIHKNKRAVCYNRPFNKLSDYWKERWCIPRSERTQAWKNFEADSFFNKQLSQINHL